MEMICIKKATPDSVNQLQAIGRQSFFETFSASNTEEDIRQYVREGFSTEKLVAELSNPDSEFYFAIVADAVIGYLKMNVGAAQTELKDEGALEIERIYVLQQYHGKKVGQLLYEKAIQVAKERGADYVWLGVWEKNERAIRFYTKNGFVVFDTHLFKLGSDEQTDIMMKLKLNR